MDLPLILAGMLPIEPGTATAGPTSGCPHTARPAAQRPAATWIPSGAQRLVVTLRCIQGVTLGSGGPGVGLVHAAVNPGISIEASMQDLL